MISIDTYVISVLGSKVRIDNWSLKAAHLICFSHIVSLNFGTFLSFLRSGAAEGNSKMFDMNFNFDFFDFLVTIQNVALFVVVV